MIKISEEDSIIFYTRYLAAYLVEQELDGAKHLWKRLPAEWKVESNALPYIWIIATKLWENDLRAAYDAVSLVTERFPLLKELFDDIVQGIRKRQMKYIMQSYSVISIASLSYRLNLSSEEAINGKIFSSGKTLEQHTCNDSRLFV